MVKYRGDKDNFGDVGSYFTQDMKDDHTDLRDVKTKGVQTLTETIYSTRINLPKVDTEVKDGKISRVTVTHPGGFVTKDSGSREQFTTGSVRDTRKGKGRYDLISPVALRRLAGVYERGAEKYDAWNWSKGQPFSRLLDSTLRHLNEYREGMRDEDHLAQAAWNIFALLHFDEVMPELNDIPTFCNEDGKYPGLEIGE